MEKAQKAQRQSDIFTEFTVLPRCRESGLVNSSFSSDGKHFKVYLIRTSIYMYIALLFEQQHPSQKSVDTPHPYSLWIIKSIKVKRIVSAPTQGSISIFYRTRHTINVQLSFYFSFLPTSIYQTSFVPFLGIFQNISVTLNDSKDI